MSYAIELRRAARRQLRSLPQDIQLRLAPRINSLADDPRPPGTRRMVGVGGSYRLRVGDYRVVYDIDDAAGLITIVAVGHRSDIYR